MPAISCIVLMPFGRTPEEQLFSKLIYQDVIAPASKDLDVEFTRIDSQRLLDRPISAEVEEQLRSAPLAIMDLSGNNANVYYELGFRRACGKPFVCIARDVEPQAFYGRQYQVINYATGPATEAIRGAIRRALAELQDPEDSAEALDRLLDELRPKKFLNPFQRRVSEWRARKTISMLTGIANRDWQLDTLSPSRYAIYIFSSIVALLGSGDEYLTVSNSRFWINPDINRMAFLGANVDAVQRGAKIRRVILIPQRDLDDPIRRDEIKRMLKKHEVGVGEAGVIGEASMVVKVLVVDELSEALDRYGHFAVARVMTPGSQSDRGALVVVPQYGHWRDADSVSTVRLLFSNGSVKQDPDTHGYLRKFEAADANAVDLGAFLDTFEANPVEPSGPRRL